MNLNVCLTFCAKIAVGLDRSLFRNIVIQFNLSSKASTDSTTLSLLPVITDIELKYSFSGMVTCNYSKNSRSGTLQMTYSF